jgi:hypothetical protein
MAAYRGSADDTLKHATDSTYTALFSAVDAYLVGRRVSILSSDAVQANDLDLQHNWQTVLDSASKAWVVSQFQLDRLLQLRIDKLLARMDLSLVITGALVGLSVIIAIMTLANRAAVGAT